MRKAAALLLGTLLPFSGLSGIGHAQSSVQIQGTIQAVDCQAQTVVLSGPSASNTIAAGPYTAVLVNSTSVPFCSLQQYLGASATAWLLASGNEFVATRIDVVAQVYVAPPPPAVVVEPLPIEGIVLGTIIVAGLVFLLARDYDGHYYRYPYYGPYYHYYYRPKYRPYFGPVPVLAAIIVAPPVLVGFVLGVTVVEGLEYLVVRDRDGGFYRYPYYGPYHRHYYRSEYRPYRGPHFDAPVREGEPRWDAPTYQVPHTQSGPRDYEPADHSPIQQAAPPRWTPPVNQNAPGYSNDPRRDAPGDHAPSNHAPGQQVVPPRRTPPANQNASGYSNDPRRDVPGDHGPSTHAPVQQVVPPRRTPPANQDASGSRHPSQQCEGPASNQSCGDQGSPKR